MIILNGICVMLSWTYDEKGYPSLDLNSQIGVLESPTLTIFTHIRSTTLYFRQVIEGRVSIYSYIIISSSSSAKKMGCYI